MRDSASAAATPSAASVGCGALLRRSSRVSMNCTCSFVAAPVPTTAFLISAGGNSWIDEIRLLRREQDHAARVAEHDGRANVLGVEHILDRERVGTMALDELDDIFIDLARRAGSGSRACVRITPHSTSEGEPNGSPCTTP